MIQEFSLIRFVLANNVSSVEPKLHSDEMHDCKEISIEINKMMRKCCISYMLQKFKSCCVILEFLTSRGSVICEFGGNINFNKHQPCQALVDSGFIQCWSIFMTDDVVICVSPVITRWPWNLGKECMDKIINDPRNHRVVIPFIFFLLFKNVLLLLLISFIFFLSLRRDGWSRNIDKILLFCSCRWIIYRPYNDQNLTTKLSQENF